MIYVLYLRISLNENKTKFTVLNNFFINQLKLQFAGHSLITREELFDFYRSFEPDLKEATFGWRIHDLKEKNLLRPVKMGIYTLSGKPGFHPAFEPKLKDLAGKIRRQFPAARYCVWNTRWLNEWMVHQPGRFLMLAEVEASAAESAFYFLKDNHYKHVFLNPDDTLLERYVYEQTETIIVKTLVSKAPVKKELKLNVPAIEKILADLFTDRKLFAPFQGSELTHIFNTVHQQYAVNVTKLQAYARRRGKEQELLDFITKNTKLKELLSV